MGLDESLKIKTKIFVQSQEQVAQGVKDREIIAIKSLTKSIKTNPKVKYLQNSYGDPLISHKIKGSCWSANKWRHVGRTSYLCLSNI